MIRLFIEATINEIKTMFMEHKTSMLIVAGAAFALGAILM